MTLLTERFPTAQPQSVSAEGGGCHGVAPLDPFLYQDMRWCADCGGAQMFVPVDRFPGGWRGYCQGCEQTKYVMDERTNSEAA